jgi:hypothetical protein
VEVPEATEHRIEQIVDQGLAERQGRRLVFSHNLIHTLRRRLHVVADAALLQLFTRRTGALLRWQKKRGILRSVKDPEHGRFDLWEIAV